MLLRFARWIVRLRRGTWHQGALPLPSSPDGLPDPARQFDLAETLFQGMTNFPPRPQQAVHWYLAAARQGWAPAMRRLGELWEKGHAGAPDPAEAQRWYRRAEAAERTGRR